MVTRTAVSLSCGLPVLHVPFTETSEFVRDHGAGWLVESEDLDGIRNALKEAVSDPGILAARRARAQEVAREVLEPATATEPLHRILEDLW
jgi:glycosyltransferase involved in cell wall biosynthesis